jgi:Mn2+/Fe2+ NRAMP family transporter
MDSGKPAVTKPELNFMRTQTLVGMIFSNIIMFFIIITAAATFQAAGINDIKSASDAATSLKPLAGNLAFSLFALAIISSALLAIPVVADSSAYSFSETFKL